MSKSSVYVHLKKHKRRGQRSEEDASEREITYHCPMEKCNASFDKKAKLRAHILKHFPDTAKPEDAARIDVIPLLQHGVGAKQMVVQPAAVEVMSRAYMNNSELWISQLLKTRLKHKGWTAAIKCLL